MKILWHGPIFNPTGIATAGREMVKAINKIEDIEIQATDPFHSNYDFNKGLEILNSPIDCKDCNATITFDYPQAIQKAFFGKRIGHFIHEGTKLPDGWAQIINSYDKVFVCSEANRKMFKWNGVIKPIETINYGFNPEIYKISKDEKLGSFIFLSVNSWTGNTGDRKGTDLLIKAFDEEFKDEDVKLLLKISTFWQAVDPLFYQRAVIGILGHPNEKIMINDKCISEEELVKYYQKSDCFVAPTRGEGFGLTILNSLACGCPVIVSNDINSGHMDFCKGNPGVLFIKCPTVKQGDPKFFCQGNMLAEPDLNDLKKQMRWAYENRSKLIEMGKEGSEFVKDFTWENTSKKIVEFIK